MRNSKNLRKIKKKASGGRTVIHMRKANSRNILCRNCGAKLNRAKLSVGQLRKLPKTKKRPQRPFPDLCSKCMRKYFKESVRNA